MSSPRAVSRWQLWIDSVGAQCSACLGRTAGRCRLSARLATGGEGVRVVKSEEFPPKLAGTSSKVARVVCLMVGRI